MDSVSVVIAVYNEALVIPALYQSLNDVLTAYSIESEVIFIDDGSIDTSVEVIQTIARKDDRIRLIELPDNKGQCYAFGEGFRAARYEIIVTLDADLQNDPHDIPVLVDKLTQGFDLVCGWRQSRSDVWHKRWKSLIANKVQRRLSGLKIHDMCCGLRAYRKDILENIELKERYSICLIPLLIARKTDKITEVKVKHHSRMMGKSKYSFFTTCFGVTYSYVRYLLNKRNRI